MQERPTAKRRLDRGLDGPVRFCTTVNDWPVYCLAAPTLQILTVEAAPVPIPAGANARHFVSSGTKAPVVGTHPQKPSHHAIARTYRSEGPR